MLFKRFAYLMILSALPGLALADANLANGDAYTVYASANGQALAAIFQSIKGMVGSDSYLTLLAFVALLAFIGYAVMATMNAKKIEGFLGILILIVVVTEVGVKQTADVVIEDPLNGTVHAVENVPAGVVVPIAMISTVGQEVTAMLEQFFTTPQSLKVSETGTIGMASSLVRDASRMSIRDSNLKATLANFSNDCILPSIASGWVSGSDIVRSTQLFGTNGTLSYVNPSLLTTAYGQDNSGRGTEAVIYCGPGSGGGTEEITYENYFGDVTVTADNAYDYLSKLIEEGAPRALAQGQGVAYGTPAYSWLEGAISSAQTYLSEGALTASGGDSVRQAAATNLLTEGLSSAAAQSGDSALASSVAFAQAIKGQESNWVMSAQIFNDISGYIFSLLQALMIGLMPLIVVAAFVPGTKMKILISVAQIFLWLAMWQPTFAILNFIITEYAQGPFGGAIRDVNYSMMTAPVVSETTNRFIAAAGFMGASIPMITWGIVKGGMALTSFVGGAMGGSFASAAANMAATGNISLGNQSYDNYSAQSTKIGGTSVGVGSVDSQLDPIGAATTNSNMGGMGATKDGARISPADIQSSQEAMAKIANTQSAAASSMISNAQQAERAAAETIMRQASQQGGSTQAAGNSSKRSESEGISDVREAVEQTAEELVQSNTFETKEEAQNAVYAALNAKGGLDFGGKKGGGGGWFGGQTGADASGGTRNAATTSGSESDSSGTSVRDGSSNSSRQSVSDDLKLSDEQMRSVETRFAENYAKTAGLTDSEAYKRLQTAQEDFREGQELQQTAEQAQRASMSSTYSGGFSNIADLQRYIDKNEKLLDRFENDGVHVAGEAQMAADWREQADALRQEANINTDNVDQVGARTAGGVDASAAGQVDRELSRAESGSANGPDDGTPIVGGISDRDVIEARRAGLSSAQEAAQEVVSQRAGDSQDAASQELNKSVLDFSRSLDKLDSGDLGKVAAAMGLSVAGQTTASVVGGKMADAALEKGKGWLDKAKGLVDDVMKRGSDFIDSTDVGRLKNSVDKLGTDEAMDFLKNNDKLHSKLAKEFGEEAVEKVATRAGASMIAGATGVGAPIAIAGGALTAYDAYQMMGTVADAMEGHALNQTINGMDSPEAQNFARDNNLPLDSSLLNSTGQGSTVLEGLMDGSISPRQAETEYGVDPSELQQYNFSR